jgi:hypothetical protein
MNLKCFSCLNEQIIFTIRICSGIYSETWWNCHIRYEGMLSETGVNYLPLNLEEKIVRNVKIDCFVVWLSEQTKIVIECIHMN